MFINNEISIFDCIYAITEIVDLAAPVLNNHNKKVACLSYRIALEMKLSDEAIQDLMFASMLHGVGVFSTRGYIKSHIFEPDEFCNKQACMGHKLLKNFKPLERAATIIKYHYKSYDKLDRDIPIGSYIIHLADRLAVMFDMYREIVPQIPGVFVRVMQKRKTFHPDIIDAFFKLINLEHVWVELFSPSFNNTIFEKINFSKKITDTKTLRNFAKIISQIVDYRSIYTVTHSSGVAAVASEIASIYGLSENECKQIEIAGLFHDVGKLAITSDIFEKTGRLNDEDFNSIRKHTYYTHSALSKIKGLEHIADWASHHHERQDGSGYPSNLKDTQICEQARIMAIADILSALTEDRPHRRGMERREILKMLHNMARNNVIDSDIVHLLNDNFLHISYILNKAQQQAITEYEIFHSNLEYTFLTDGVCISCWI